MPIDKRRILFEDDHLLIVTKLAGELVVAADGEGKLPLFDFLKKQYPSLRVVHRIDYQTSGIVVFAKVPSVVDYVRSTKFAGWEKTYRAIVAGQLSRVSGTITAKLPARMKKDELVDAVSHYRVVTTYRDATDVEIRIDTGRKHQIRQHMAGIGHPLLRDPLYGNRRADETFARRYGYSKFFLHAIRLSLPHPVTKETIAVSAPLPVAYVELLRKLASPPAAAPLTQKRGAAGAGKKKLRHKAQSRFAPQWKGKGLRRNRGAIRRSGR